MRATSSWLSNENAESIAKVECVNHLHFNQQQEAMATEKHFPAMNTCRHHCRELPAKAQCKRFHSQCWSPGVIFAMCRCVNHLSELGGGRSEHFFSPRKYLPNHHFTFKWNLFVGIILLVILYIVLFLLHRKVVFKIFGSPLYFLKGMFGCC